MAVNNDIFYGFGDSKTKGYTAVYSFGTGCKTFEAVSANRTKQRLVPSVLGSRCCVKEITVPCQESLLNESRDCDQYYQQQMSWKHLKEGLLDKLHHQMQIAYIHCSQIVLKKPTFSHKIHVNLNHAACLRADGYT